MEIIKNIFENSGQIWFEGEKNHDKMARFFADLYRIELYKDGLDLILTKIKHKKIKFEIRIITNWDTNIGCYLTEQNKIFNKLLGNFTTQISQKIILRQLTHNVMAHEMAHALEFSSGLNLKEEFRQSIALDMKDRQPSLITLQAEIKRLMIEAVKSYPPTQIISELFARYFELLSVARDICGKGNFTTIQITDYFINTTNYIKKIFNLALKNQIDPEISKATSELVNKITQTAAQVKFSDQSESFHKKGGIEVGQKWSRNINSNFALPINLQKHTQIEDKK
jgi:hypothetical protein